MRSVHAAGEGFTYQKRCGASSAAACLGSAAAAPAQQPCANGAPAAAGKAPERADANGAFAPERSPLPTVGHGPKQEQPQHQIQRGAQQKLANGAGGGAQANGVRIDAR